MQLVEFIVLIGMADFRAHLIAGFNHEYAVFGLLVFMGKYTCNWVDKWLVGDLEMGIEIADSSSLG